MSKYHLICICESISWCYGHGFDWINLGFPMYVAIDWKPNNGADIKDTACGVSGIFIRFKIVKGVTDYGNNYSGNDLLYGKKLLLHLVKFWCNTNWLDSEYFDFEFVSESELMVRNGFKFVGVIKTDTRKFPLAHLSRIEIVNRVIHMVCWGVIQWTLMNMIYWIMLFMYRYRR